MGIIAGLLTHFLYPPCLRRILIRDTDGFSESKRSNLICMLYVRAVSLQSNSKGLFFNHVHPFFSSTLVLRPNTQAYIQPLPCFAMSPTSLSARGVDIHESKAPQFYAAAITSYVLAVAAVALRFWARKLMKTELWVDDWTVAGALVIF